MQEYEYETDDQYDNDLDDYEYIQDNYEVDMEEILNIPENEQ